MSLKNFREIFVLNGVIIALDFRSKLKGRLAEHDPLSIP
jgi:hypothetical protein